MGSRRHGLNRALYKYDRYMQESESSSQPPQQPQNDFSDAPRRPAGRLSVTASGNSNYGASWVNVTVKFRFSSSSSGAGHGERGYWRGTNYSPKREAGPRIETVGIGRKRIRRASLASRCGRVLVRRVDDSFGDHVSVLIAGNKNIKQVRSAWKANI